MRVQDYPRLFAGLLILLTGITLVARYLADFDSRGRSVPVDFARYIKARDLVFDHKNPYVIQENVHSFKYAPVTLGFFKLLPQSDREAWKVFLVTSVLIFCFALLLGSTYEEWRQVWYLVLGLALGWKGIIEALDYGQVDLLLYGLSIFSVVLLDPQPVLSGLILGILPWIKPAWGVLFVPCFITALTLGRMRLSKFTSGWCFTMFLMGAAGPSLIFGTEVGYQLSKSWMEILKHQPHELLVDPVNQSIFATLWRFFDFKLGLGIGLLVCGVLFGLLLQRGAWTETKTNRFRLLTPWLLFIDLASPLGWRWGSLGMIGVFFGRLRKNQVLFVLLILLVLIQQGPIARMFGLNHWTDLHRYGTVTWLWLVAFLLTI